MRKRKIYTSIFFFIGIVLFIFFLYEFGLSTIRLVAYNINFYYLFIFFFIALLACFPLVWRWQIILKAYYIRIPFITLLRQSIAGYSISYITPFMRLGGEPMRAIMLKKECDVDYKTGSSSLILDKFMEFVGTILFGIVGLIMLFFAINISNNLKGILFLLVLSGVFILFVFYCRTVKNKGTFSSLFNLLRLYKIQKWKNFNDVLLEVEEKMADFFINHKKEFFLSLFFYCMSGIIFVLEFKFALLSFGINASLTEIILAVIVLGLANLTPIPAGLGALEGGQAGLFYLLMGEGSIGLALTLLLRVRSLFIIAIGFFIISHFTSKGYLRSEKDG